VPAVRAHFFIYTQTHAYVYAYTHANIYTYTHTHPHPHTPPSAPRNSLVMSVELHQTAFNQARVRGSLHEIDV